MCRIDSIISEIHLILLKIILYFQKAKFKKKMFTFCSFFGIIVHVLHSPLWNAHTFIPKVFWIFHGIFRFKLFQYKSIFFIAVERNFRQINFYFPKNKFLFAVPKKVIVSNVCLLIRIKFPLREMKNEVV